MFVTDNRRKEVWVYVTYGGHELFSVGWFQVTQKDANLITLDEPDVAERTHASALAYLAGV